MRPQTHENSQLKGWSEGKLDPVPAAAACGGTALHYCNVALCCKITFLNFYGLSAVWVQDQSAFQNEKKKRGWCRLYSKEQNLGISHSLTEQNAGWAKHSIKQNKWYPSPALILTFCFSSIILLCLGEFSVVFFISHTFHGNSWVLLNCICFAPS